MSTAPTVLFARQRLHASAKVEGLTHTGTRPCCSCVTTTPAAPRWRRVCSPTSQANTPSPGPAGREPGEEINPAAVEAMAEIGIDITGDYPKPWTEILEVADVIVTMGCGDACPVYPGRRYEDWDLPDPGGLDVAAIRPIRAEIETRVRVLLAELGVPAARKALS